MPLNKGLFPYSKPRPGQMEMIEDIYKAFESQRKMIIIECPTGSGKSAIAYTIAKHFRSTYYLTATKILQSQLINSFSADKSLVALKGRSSYACKMWPEYIRKTATGEIKLKTAMIAHVSSPEFNFNCNVGVCKMIMKKNNNPECVESACDVFGNVIHNYKCPYWAQKNAAKNAQICVMNFDSFLYQTTYSPQDWGQRSLMVIDEAHNQEEKLLDFVSVSISDRDVGLDFKKFDTPTQYVKYFNDIGLFRHILTLMEAADLAGDLKEREKFEKMLDKIKMLEVVDDKWICNFKSIGKHHTVELKPLFVRDFAGLLYGRAERVLMMSATILSAKTMAESLGFGDDYVFLKMPSSFPPKNRPIYIDGCGSLKFKNKQETFPRLVNKVDEICDKYADKRGIIHTHNFEIANLLMNSCKNRKRFLYQKNYISKDDMLEDHSKSKNGVIVAPAMHEGIDLIDDLSRFQIICKVPYPNQEDNPQLKKRVEMSWHYYLWLTSLRICQAYGRSVRHENDWADTYIIDSDFVKFFDMAANMLPEWFVEAIVA